MASVQNGIESHKKLCAYMRQPLLEEFVRRVVMKKYVIGGKFKQVSKLSEDCKHEIESYNSQLGSDLVINTVFKKSNVSVQDDYYVVIEFIKHGIKLGHITFHLVYNKCNRDTNKGPLHIINNQSNKRARRLYINQDAELANCLVIYVGDIWIKPHNIGTEIYKLSTFAINIINIYLQSAQQNALSLENHLADHVQLNNQTQAFITDILRLNARCFKGGRGSTAEHAGGRCTQRHQRKRRNATRRR